MGGSAEKGKRAAGAETAGEERQRGDPCIRRIKSKRLMSIYIHISSHSLFSHAHHIFTMEHGLNMHIHSGAGLLYTLDLPTHYLCLLMSPVPSPREIQGLMYKTFEVFLLSTTP